MLIGGWQKVSLLDYPGKVATIIFTQGCCFRCGFCHNPSLVIRNSGSKITEESFFRYLNQRKKVIQAVVVTGGEPTLQRDLEKFIRKLKKLGFLVKLDTNGYHPGVVKRLIKKKLVDYIAMDIKAKFSKYHLLVGLKLDMNKVKRSIRLILKSKIPHEFRTTVIKGLHSTADLVGIAKFIRGADAYFLQKFKSRDELVDASFKDKETLTDRELKDVAKRCLKYVKKCEVR